MVSSSHHAPLENTMNSWWKNMNKRDKLKEDLNIVNTSARFNLKEVDGEKELTIKIVNDLGDGIFILPEGYGEYCAAPGEGAPIAIEIWQGKLRVLIWGDINTEEPTDIIHLEGAHESKRRP
jgi:hypothetical protein